jgi:hypothetical protein
VANFPAIQAPEATLPSLLTTTQQLKEAVEILTGQRGDAAALGSGLAELEGALARIIAELARLQEFINRRLLILQNEVDKVRRPGMSTTFEELFNKVSTLSVDDLENFQDDVANFLIDFGVPFTVDGLPPTAGYDGAKLVYDTVTSALYEFVAGNWVPVFDEAAVTAAVDAAIAAGIAASNITGQLTDTQIAAIDAAKITGQITGTQITDGAISTPKLAAGSVSTAALAAGAVTADTIASNAITAVKLAAGSVEAAKIAAGAVQAGSIAAGAVTADKVAANAIAAGNIQANAVTAGKVAAAAIGANELTANAVVAGKIAAGAIDGIQITGSLIRTNNTTSRVELNTSDNSINVFRGGATVARISSPATSFGVITAFPISDNYGIVSIGSGLQVGGLCSGSNFGVYGESTSGIGVRGLSGGSNVGVSGFCSGGIGTFGQGIVGVVGRGGTGNIGVRADRNSDGAAALGSMQAASYLNFTGAHMDVIDKADLAEPGDILIPDGVFLRASVMDSLINVKRSTGANQPAAGVFIENAPLAASPLLVSTDADTGQTALKPEYETLDTTHELATYAALGEGCMNICGEGGDLAVGDLIVTSSIPGKGMKKANNTMDNTVVAKAREAMTFTGPTEVKFVAVVFLCG